MRLLHRDKSPKSGYIKIRAHPDREQQVEEIADELDVDDESDVVREAIHRMHMDEVRGEDDQDADDPDEEDVDYWAFKIARKISGGGNA